MTVAVSQVGDERPLTQGKFSPDSQYFATCEFITTESSMRVPTICPVSSHNRLVIVAYPPCSKLGWVRQGVDRAFLSSQADAQGARGQGMYCDLYR
jgi:hypothetical protein